MGDRIVLKILEKLSYANFPLMLRYRSKDVAEVREGLRYSWESVCLGLC